MLITPWHRINDFANHRQRVTAPQELPNKKLDMIQKCALFKVASEQADQLGFDNRTENRRVVAAVRRSVAIRTQWLPEGLKGEEPNVYRYEHI